MANWFKQLYPEWEEITGFPVVWNEKYQVSGYEYYAAKPELSDSPHYEYPLGFLVYRRKIDGYKQV